MKLKNIAEQTIVITGASSGIGLSTARMAAEQGAKLVLIARNEDALRELTEEINAKGGRAVYVAGDVADERVLREAANRAKAEFGGFDTWVNNAGGSIYGRIMEVPTEDFRRMFDTNVWGVLNGSRVAVEHLRERGGALINVGSEVSDAVVPLQGMYSASKHAVKALTEALRMELEADGLPISVTVIKPTAINTPFPQNAKNYLPYEPDLPSPVYAPELVAEAILHCAQNPMTEFYVGETARLHSTMATMMPRLSEKMNEMTIDSSQNSGRPARRGRHDGLYGTNSNLRERGRPERFTMENSVYQRAVMHPFVSGALAVGAGLGIAALLSSRYSKQLGKYLPKNLGGERRPAGGRQLNFRHDLREKMEVVGSDGEHVGTIDRVENGEIKLTRKDSADGVHHFISTAEVLRVEGDRAILRRTADAARASWRADNAPGRATTRTAGATGGGTNLGLREKMRVVGSDGTILGVIDHVENDRIKLTRKDSLDGQHHYLPITDIERVEDDRAILRVTAIAARASWTDEDETQVGDRSRTTGGSL